MPKITLITSTCQAVPAVTLLFGIRGGGIDTAQRVSRKGLEDGHHECLHSALGHILRTSCCPELHHVVSGTQAPWQYRKL